MNFRLSPRMTKKRQDSPQGLPKGPGIIAITLTILLVTLGGARSAQAATRVVTLVTSQGNAYEEVRARISKSLEHVDELVLHSFDVGELDILDKSTPHFRDSELVVTVGTSALKYMATNHPEATVLAVFVTSYSYQAVMAEVSPRDHRFFGLFIDQPLERYLLLTRLLLPEATALSVSGLELANGVAQQENTPISHCNFQLEAVKMSADSNPIRLLDSYYTRSDAFLVFPQSSAQNRNIAKWILYLASRHRKPVIAFSEKYVDGGALASVFAAPSDIAKETHDVLAKWQSTGIPEVPWGKTGNIFTVKTNSRIARFLKLDIASESQLQMNLAKEGIAQHCEQNET
ncbi:MAG: hypothetical protein AB8B81_12970 [Halioglobus sp.]